MRKYESAINWALVAVLLFLLSFSIPDYKSVALVVLAGNGSPSTSYDSGGSGYDNGGGYDSSGYDNGGGYDSGGYDNGGGYDSGGSDGGSWDSGGSDGGDSGSW